MAYVWQRWMADEYRAAGLTVVETEGWENRGRPASTGNFDPRGPETVHHTGSTASPSNPRPSLGTLIQGRDDLPGPLCQKATAYDGTVILIAAGRANHAGPVGKFGVLGMPLGADGNALALGNEVMTDGTQHLPEAQRRSIAIQAAVDMRHFGRDAEWTHRHEDISGSGKWDIGQLTTAELRADVRAALNHLEDDMASPEVQAQLDEIQRLDEQILQELRAFRKGKTKSDGKVRAKLEKLRDDAGDHATKSQVDEVLALLDAEDDE